MRSSSWTHCIVACVFLLGTAARAQTSTTSTEVFFSQVYDYGKNRWSTNQNKRNSIDRKLASFIGAAKKTLDAALFEIHNDNIANALIAAHRRGVKVRLVSDYQYRAVTRTKAHVCPHYALLEAAKVPIVYDTKTSLMHNKFLVRDAKCVWTGSFNSVDSEAWANHNNAIKICNAQLAKNFTTEFEEMFVSKQFGLGSPANTTKAPIRVNSTTTVETCFAPEDFCGRMVVDKILAAQKRIRIMAFSVTDFIPRGAEPLRVRKTMPTIKSAILARKAAGVDVSAVVEHKKANAPGSIVPAMLLAKIPVRADGNPGVLHSKVIVIDGKLTIIGSFNFSREADAGNDENMVVVKNSSVARKYEAEFKRIWDAGKAVPPPRTCDPSKPVNINTATTTAIGNLPGMGWKGAQNVVRGRPYRSIRDLLTRKILTTKQYNAIRQCLTARKR